MSSSDKSNERTWTEAIGQNLQGAKEAIVGKSEQQIEKETAGAKESVHTDKADSSAGSTWDNIKKAASSATDQAANKIDKNTSEFKAKTKEGGESLDHSLEKAGAKGDEKEAKADTKSYLSSAWEGAKQTASHVTDAASNKAHKNKIEGDQQTTEAREKMADKIDPHKK